MLLDAGRMDLDFERNAPRFYPSVSVPAAARQYSAAAVRIMRAVHRYFSLASRIRRSNSMCYIQSSQPTVPTHMQSKRQPTALDLERNRDIRDALLE